MRFSHPTPREPLLLFISFLFILLCLSLALIEYFSLQSIRIDISCSPFCSPKSELYSYFVEQAYSILLFLRKKSCPRYPRLPALLAVACRLGSSSLTATCGRSVERRVEAFWKQAYCFALVEVRTVEISCLRESRVTIKKGY